MVNDSYLFTDELLSEEFAGLKHVWDVIERPESLVFVLVFLLNTIEEEGGMGGDKKMLKLFTLGIQSFTAKLIC